VVAEDRTATGPSPSAVQASVISRAMSSGIGREVNPSRRSPATAR
jgi:hypothetical protein